MSSPCMCSNGHRYMSDDIPGEYFDLGEPPCPKCALIWWRERSEHLTNLQRANIKPGDALVLQYEGHMPPSEMTRLSAFFDAFFPGTKTFILERGIKLSILARDSD